MCSFLYTLIHVSASRCTATAGVQSCQGAEGYAAYRYAQLLLQTRAFKLPTGPVLCPLIDLTNHLSIGANARTKLESGSNSNSGRSDSGETVEDSCLVLRATRALTAGEEVFKNYDPDADYSDIFERCHKQYHYVCFTYATLSSRTLLYMLNN